MQSILEHSFFSLAKTHMIGRWISFQFGYCHFLCHEKFTMTVDQYVFDNKLIGAI